MSFFLKELWIHVTGFYIKSVRVKELRATESEVLELEMLSSFCILSHGLYPTTLWGYYDYSYFVDEEIEAWRSYMTFVFGRVTRKWQNLEGISPW